MYHLLSEKQHKADKANQFGYLQGMLQLQPLHKITKKQRENLRDEGFQNIRNNLCPFAGACADVCIQHAGFNSDVLNKHAVPKRNSRTELLLNETPCFMGLLYADLYELSRKAKALKLKSVARLNCLSDLYWPAAIFDKFPDIQFLDYTKDESKLIDAASSPHWPTNYHLTFSYNEKMNPFLFHTYIKPHPKKVNIAVVFDVSRNSDLPSEYLGHPVIDGDINDLRFLDTSGAIIGLRFKQPLIKGGFKRSKKFSLFVLPA